MEKPTFASPPGPFDDVEPSILEHELTPTKMSVTAHGVEADKKEGLTTEIKAVSSPDSASVHSDETEDPDHIIITGADAARHLLPMRDDFDPAITFRSMFLSTGLTCFSAVMYQIYQVRQASEMRILVCLTLV